VQNEIKLSSMFSIRTPDFTGRDRAQRGGGFETTSFHNPFL